MNKKAIICVDDERMVLISLRDQLVRYLGNEYNIELAESAEEALELFEELQEEEFEIPLLIADQIMPGMKGDELLIKIYSQYPKTLKILLTGQASGEAVGNAVNFARLYRYIAKPWDEADLRLTVAEAIRSYFQDKQVCEQNEELQKVNIDLQQLNASLEQKVAERTVKLAKAEAELRAIFAAMTELIFVVDQQGKYLKIISNDSALLYNPAPAKTLIGKTIYEVFEAKQADTFLEYIQQALHTQQTVNIEYNLTIGKQVFWFAANISPISSISVIWVARDMTERRFLEEKLRTSEEKIRAVFEAMTDIVLVIDEKKSIELAPTNIKKLYDLEADPINKTVEQFFVEETNKIWLEKIEQALTTQETIYFDYSLTLNNREAWFTASISPMPNNSVIWVARNIDERKIAEAVMEQAKVAAEVANQAKSDFLANMSHELRTPLNGILGYAQILQLDKDCTSKQQNGLEIIYKCGEHLLTLINDILDLAKIEAQKLELYANDFNFPYFLKGVSDICRIKAEQKYLNFIYQPINKLPDTVNADEKRLRQVLINLLSNAIKFTDAGSVTFKVEVIENLATEVTQEIDTVATDNTKQLILTSSDNSSIQSLIKIRFQIEDTGIGMTSEQLEKIFSPFEQVGDTSRRIEGTGLGLSITKKIIAMMESEIFVESISGVGSLFRFDVNLPETDKPIQSTNLNSFYNIVGYQGKKQKILVVDDNSGNCSVIIHILEPIGFEVQSASNGQEGLKQAVKFRPDLIITDLMMPVMDGFEMARQLRKSSEFTNTTILATSARVSEFEQQKSQQFGCQDFISKPIKVEELLKKLKYYLKLTWIYKTHNVIEANSVYEPLSAIVMPPAEELANIYKAAQIGHNEGIKQEATRLKQLDSKYTQFANKLLELAEDFKDEEIMKMIDEVAEV
ncbi:MAG: response regulator [Coleofasciculaceae cyanobacterium]